MTTLSILIPTMGRPSIERAVLSYLPQMHPGDELLVLGDTRNGPLLDTEAILEKYRPLVRYVPVPSTHCTFGHAELNHGLDISKGDYIVCNDDDDCATEHALGIIRAVVSNLEEPTPLLFKYRAYHGPIYWHEAGCLAEGHIGGHCLVTPNLPGLVGRFTERYQGDWDWVMNTLTRWPGGIHSAAWVDAMIAIARPQEPWADTTMPAPILAAVSQS